MPGPQPPAIPFPGGQPFGEYLIRSEADMAALMQSIRDDFDRTPWDAWLDNEMGELEKLHDERFRTAASLFFTSAGGWAPNAQSTVRRKGHARVLFGVPSQGFRLYKSLTQRQSEFGIRYPIDQWPTRVQVVFGTDAPYSAPNQFGVPSKNIPARPHVGMTEEHVDKVAQRAVDHVFAAIQES